MACYHPIDVWKQDDGSIKFSDLGSGRHLQIPCSRCIGCRLARSRAWAVRCMHESQMHSESSFVTLTYDEENFKPSLEYSDFQRFMYRVRERFGPTRFFMGGEYGEHTLRPHFHALLFGRSFKRGDQVSKDAFSSPDLSKLWKFGFSSVGEVSYQSAQYVAKYCHKKCTGPLADSHYCRVDKRTGEYVYVKPEFGHMSLKPAIGYTWFQKFWRDVYGARDGVPLPGGVVVPPPRYYDTLLSRMEGVLIDDKKFERSKRVRGGASLESQELVAEARVKFYNNCKL